MRVLALAIWYFPGSGEILRDLGGLEKAVAIIETKRTMAYYVQICTNGHFLFWRLQQGVPTGFALLVLQVGTPVGWLARTFFRQLW